MRVLPRNAQCAAGSAGAPTSTDALPTMHATAVSGADPRRPLYACSDGQVWMRDWLRDVHAGTANRLQRLRVDAR